MIELQAPVGQLAEPEVEIFVDRAGVDDVVGDLERTILELAKVDARADVDQRVVDHALEHLGVAVERHGLERVGEIAVVGVRARRNA